MDHHIPPIFILTTIAATVCLSLLTTLPHSLADNFTDCSRPFNCGPVSDITYPFWSDKRPPFCRGGWEFKLNCSGDHQHASIQTWSGNFGVLNIDTTNYILTMFREDLTANVCSPDPGVVEFKNSKLFKLVPEDNHNITIFYNCPSGASYGSGNNNIYKCPNDDHPIAFFDDAFYEDYFDDCKWPRIKVPELQGVRLDPNGGIDALKAALTKGFEVKYDVSQDCAACLQSGGACGTNDTDTYQFSCHCPDGRSYASHCPGHRGLTLGARLSIGVGAAVLVVLAVCMAIYFSQRQKKTTHYEISYVQSRSLSSDPSLRDTEKGSQYFGVPLFTYSELEEATNNFDSSRELGDGGFGTVYFGKLQDGRCVAVKRLYENNYKRVEQFRNEIKILAGLRHPNLVSLYGCTSRHSRELLLVYEYIPNGTVADHLHGERAKAGTLPWHIRMKIAVETATALAYLHAKDIIHRDVKTYNILLDNHFVVKVADFGLSRLFPNNVTHISTAPQGTPGYVDPEYHECYQLTDKSDVYSFGVVLVELISSLPAVDITRHRHEINLSNMAINKIKNRALHELVDQELGFESDFKVRKMIKAVAELAFQCLESSKDMRPSMEEVVDTLKDIQSDGKHKSQPEVMDISGDDVVLLKDDPPPPSPDSNAVSKSTTPNASG